jgi:cell division protein FtsL
MPVAKPISVAKLRRARAPWVFDLSPASLTLMAIVLVSVTSLLYLTQASRVAATGYDISHLEDQRAHLERQQQILLMRVAELQSLSRIEAEATGRLQMVPAAAPEYLYAGDPPVDVEAALERAEREAQHLPTGWRERLLEALRLSPQR